VIAAVKISIGLQAMADNLASAVAASWRQRMDRAFKAIEGVRLATHYHLERLIVFISADFTASHNLSSLKTSEGIVGLSGLFLRPSLC
jgi:hypothetical protein